MKRLFMTLVLILGARVLFAQAFVVKGKVVDENNLPLPGVTVVLEGNKVWTITEKDGTFTVKVVQGDRLHFTYMGYSEQVVDIRNRQNLTVKMQPAEGFAMKEVMVVGYSKQERRDVTGAVSSVKLPEQKASLSIDKMLQGMAPGVFVSSSSGALGSADVLTIRGISSIMGDNNPLYVVDGVPIYGTDRSANSVNTTGGAFAAVTMSGMQTGGGSLANNMDAKFTFEQNPLTSLNPDDIESIEILKDAFATAIYGSRGAAGVILITTKSGRRDRMNASVQYTISVDRPVGKLKLLNGPQYNAIYSMYYPKANFTSPYDTDWQDAVTRTALSHQVSASVSGGNNALHYFISLSGSNNQSYIINNDLQRYSARANLDTKMGKYITVGTSTTVSEVDNNAINAPSIYAQAIRKAPNLPIYKEDGSYTFGYFPNTYGYTEAYNPVAMAYLEKAKGQTLSLISNVFMEIEPVSWLTWRTQVGENVIYNRNYIKKPDLPKESGITACNQATETTVLRQRTVIDNTLNVNKTFGFDHFIQGVAGMSYERTLSNVTDVAGSNFFSSDMEGVGAAQTRRVTASGQTKSALMSIFTRINYQFKQRYMAGISYRYDGSSAYNRNHRFLHIPAFSIGWRFSEENFIKNRLPWINDGKIRASLGWNSKDGNNTYYGAQAIYSLSHINYGSESYLKMSQPGNLNLRWEKTKTYDLGLDVTMFDRRINLTVDYYYKRTTDMLFSSDVPSYTGYTKESQNIADMQNQGVEIQIISTNVRTRNFGWQTIVNFSRNTNKILKLNFEGNQLDQANTTFKYYAEGYAMAQWYLHEWYGVDPATGNPLWRYADGSISAVPPASDYKVSSLNKKICGTAQPQFFGSMTNTFTWKGWEASCMFTFSVGGRMMNASRADLLTYSTSNAYNLSSEILNLWQMEGQQTDIPKLANRSIINNYDYTVAITTTRFLENSSYLKLKNLEIGYSLSQKALKKSGFLAQFKVYAVAINLFTITPYSGLDPEVSAFGSSAVSAGYDNLTMPQSRSIQMGVRIGF